MTARVLTLLLAASLPLAVASAQDSANSFTAFSGTEIVDSTGKTVGALRDIVVDGDGRIVQILIGHGGLLGVGERTRILNTKVLPPIVDGKIRMDDQPAQNLAALPEYREPQPAADSERGAPPVSGANQRAPQDATSYIPVMPGTVKPSPAPAPTPSETPTTVASADASQVESPVPVQGEKTATGSGSSGMAPQQGTGTGATQASPTANEGGGQDKGVAGAGGAENPMYGREQNPESQPMPEGSSGRAAVDARSPEATADRDQLKPAGPAAIAETENPQWRIGKIVGATVHGDRDGLSVKDILFSGNAVETAVIARNGLPDISVPFDTLNIGGTADEPKIALGAPPSADQK